MKKVARAITAVSLISSAMMITQTASALSECGGHRHPDKCWDVKVCPSEAVMKERGTTCSVNFEEDHVLIPMPPEFSAAVIASGKIAHKPAKALSSSPALPSTRVKTLSVK